MFDAKNCPFLPQETPFTAFLSQMLRESQHTRFEDQILGQVSLRGRPASCASLFCINTVLKCSGHLPPMPKSNYDHLCTLYFVFVFCKCIPGPSLTDGQLRWGSLCKSLIRRLAFNITYI